MLLLEAPAPLVVGGDELAPLFLYIVLFSGCTDLYTYMEFIEYCAMLDWRDGADGQVTAHAHSVDAGLPHQAGYLVPSRNHKCPDRILKRLRRIPCAPVVGLTVATMRLSRSCR